MTWVLILTVFMPWNNGTAVTSVPGFATQEECMVAGDAASKEFRGERKTLFVCVPQTSKVKI